MAKGSARILLGVFIFSVSLIPLLDLGHDILHNFDNPFHHHQLRHRKASASHTMADHHFRKMKFSHEMDEAGPASNNFIALLYGFCQPLKENQNVLITPFQKHKTKVTESSYVVYFRPLTPPPLPDFQS